MVAAGRSDGGPGRRRPPGGFDQPCAAAWLHPLLPNPPADDEVLIPGEQILYKRRRHWLVLSQVVTRAAALVFAGLQVVLGLAGMDPVSAVLFVVSAVVLWQWAREVELWQLALSAAVVVLAVLALPGLLGVWLLGVGQALAMVVVAVLEHRCYAFLYVTNRRLVATSGIFRRDVSTMPIRRITDIRLTVSWFADWLGSLPFSWAEPYGEFNVESAGQNQALGHLPFLLDPHWFAETVLLLATRPARIDEDGT